MGIPCVVALLVVNVGYAFRGTGVSVRDTPRVSRLFSAVSAGAVGAMPLPLPRDYVIGFDEQKADNERGEFPCYLIGQWSTSGWWYYYPLAFVLKSPVPFLLLLLLPLVPPVRRRLAASRWSCACLLLPVIVMLGVLCIGNRLDIGIRYALPAFPFLTAMAAGVAGVLWGRRRTLPLAVLVLVWYAGSTLSAYPDFLAYFSEAVGGAREGHRYLLDSNLDWGQDLKELKRYMDRTGIPSVHLAYFGHVWPQQYGIRFSVLGSRPAPGYVAASVALVMGQPYAITYAGDRVLPVPAGMFTWLQRYRPVGRAGRSIWIYDIPADKLPSE